MSRETVIGALFLVLGIIVTPISGEIHFGIILFLWILGSIIIFSESSKEVDQAGTDEKRIFHRSYEEFEAENYRKWR